MSEPTVSAARLGALDSCAVSDALDALGLTGVAPSLKRLATRKRVAGRLLTVTLGTERPEGGSTRHLGTAAVEAGGPGEVVVVVQQSGVLAAGWGGILCNAAQARGLEGAIVDGPARDVDEAEEIGFPVFGRRPTCRTARGRVYETAFNVPVVVEGVSVAPQDWVLADGSGVVFVPAAEIDRVLAMAERIAGRERLMTEAVRAGEPVGQVMGRDYETLLEGQG